MLARLLCLSTPFLEALSLAVSQEEKSGIKTRRILMEKSSAVKECQNSDRNWVVAGLVIFVAMLVVAVIVTALTDQAVYGVFAGALVTIVGFAL